MSKKCIVLVIFLKSYLCYTFDCNPKYVLGHYLVNFKEVMHGRIKKISTSELQIEVIESYKGTVENSKSLSIEHHLGQDVYKIFFENQTYILFLRQVKRITLKYGYLEPCARFKVKSDSLFIGSPFLKNLESLDSTVRYQENNFSDDIFPTGLKISLTDFKQLLVEVNKSFIPSYTPSGSEIHNYSEKKSNKIKKGNRVYGYTYHNPNTLDPFTLAVIFQLKEAWGL